MSVVIPTGFGSATIDGVLHPSEWVDAGAAAIAVNTPNAGTVPGTLYAMNDGTTLYLAVQFGATASGNSASFEFDSDKSGDRRSATGWLPSEGGHAVSGGQLASSDPFRPIVANRETRSWRLVAVKQMPPLKHPW